MHTCTLAILKKIKLAPTGAYRVKNLKQNSYQHVSFEICMIYINIRVMQHRAYHFSNLRSVYDKRITVLWTSYYDKQCWSRSGTTWAMSQASFKSYQRSLPKTRLYGHRRWQEVWNFGFRKKIVLWCSETKSADQLHHSFPIYKNQVFSWRSSFDTLSDQAPPCLLLSNCGQIPKSSTGLKLTI